MARILGVGESREPANLLKPTVSCGNCRSKRRPFDGGGRAHDVLAFGSGKLREAAQKTRLIPEQVAGREVQRDVTLNSRGQHDSPGHGCAIMRSIAISTLA